MENIKLPENYADDLLNLEMEHENDDASEEISQEARSLYHVQFFLALLGSRLSNGGKAGNL